MKNNIIFNYESIRKLKNKVHKLVYNKKLGINENIINETIIISNLSIKYIIKMITEKFIGTLITENKKNETN